VLVQLVFGGSGQLKVYVNFSFKEQLFVHLALNTSLKADFLVVEVFLDSQGEVGFWLEFNG
jgi:hypothetical protein